MKKVINARHVFMQFVPDEARGYPLQKNARTGGRGEHYFRGAAANVPPDPSCERVPLPTDPAFMQMTLPAAGVCPAATVPIYRVFSNRADANHRYMTDRAVRAQMVAKGWLAEGDGPDLVVMCAPQ
jgi:hypothetical protein